MDDNKIRDKLFTETLLAARQFSIVAAGESYWSADYDASRAKFMALYTVVDSVKGLEREYQAFKSAVLKMIGIEGAALRMIEQDILLDAIERVRDGTPDKR